MRSSDVLIALDYDGTFTADPGLWIHFVQSARLLGHEVVIVTMRYPTEEVIAPLPIDVIYTSRKAKQPFMQALGRVPQIWIDDMPHFILESST